jgi:hypothetical protein
MARKGCLGKEVALPVVEKASVVQNCRGRLVRCQLRCGLTQPESSEP